MLSESGSGDPDTNNQITGKMQTRSGILRGSCGIALAKGYVQDL